MTSEQGQYKSYLGDAVYADFDGGSQSIILTTENGYRATNAIILEPQVLDQLLRYLEVLKVKLKKLEEPEEPKTNE